MIKTYEENDLGWLELTDMQATLLDRFHCIVPYT